MINWNLFRGSSHCRDTMYDFAEGYISGTDLEKCFLPFMPKMAAEAKRLVRKHGG